MPIPLMTPPQEETSSRPTFYLVPQSKQEWVGAPLAPRAIAHFIDLMVVQGFSVYSSKVLSLFLVAFHMPEIRGQGRMAGRLFRDAFSYGQGKLLVAAFVLYAFAFFLVLPRITGRTLGMGLMGLAYESADGRPPGIKSLSIRFFGCLMVYATGGMMLAPLLKKAPQPLFHDRLSQTRVVKAV